MNTIALAQHPANKDAGTRAVCDVHIGRRTGTVFVAENGYIPGFMGMTTPGYFRDEIDAIEWIEAFAKVAA